MSQNATRGAGSRGGAYSGRSRGGGQNRGGRGGRSSGGGGRSRRRDIMDGLLPDVLQTFDRPEGIDGESDVCISDVEPLASYSWTERQKPTIIVPGSPRIWSSPILPLTVPADTGASFVDQNSHRLPDYPMLPLFEAIDTLTADGSRSPPQWASVDIITDRNNLLKLAGWADSGCSSLRSKKAFRIDFELIGPWTVLMQRWNERTSVWANGGFGESFERAASHSAPGCEDTPLAGSSRIISYDLSGLKLVVRFDVDALYVSEERCSAPPIAHSMDDLADALSSLRVSSSSSPQPPKYPKGPAILRGGLDAPQASLIKLKTKSRGNSTGFPGVMEYLQLLLGQTPALRVGIHENGTFTSIKEYTLESTDFARQAEKVQPGLKKLRRLLEDIQNIALERGKGARLSLVCEKGVLQIMERSGEQPLLPDEVIRRFTA